MKTVLQELIESIQHSIDIQNELNLNATQITTLTNVKLVAEELLEKEKEQIIDAYHINPLEAKWGNIGIEYYNQTYNQNK